METAVSSQKTKWSLSNIRYVTAEEDNSCMIACLAMITDKTFREVLREMDRYWKIEGQYDGTDDDAWMAYLSARGYAIQDVDHEYSPEDRLIEPWPLRPFAPIHILSVYSEGVHAVVMLNDGTILDPDNPYIKSRHEYHRVYRMIGIWKVSEPLAFLVGETQSTVLKAKPANDE